MLKTKKADIKLLEQYHATHTKRKKRKKEKTKHHNKINDQKVIGLISRYSALKIG